MSDVAARSLGAATRQLACNMIRMLGFDQADLPPQQWQDQLRGKLIELLRMPQRAGVPLVRVIEQTDCGDYTRQKVCLLATDEVIVPAYILRPKNVPPPWPVMLALAGHGPGMCLPVDLLPEGADRQRLIVEGQRDYAVQAVRQGMMAVTPELRGFGELMLPDAATKNGNTCAQLAGRYAQVGRNLLGMRVSDLVQFVDWLSVQPDVRADAICATGNSGGGMATLFLAAADERIRLAAPSCYFCTWADSILAMDHCPCNYIADIGLYAECWDIAGLIAPRPLLIIAGETDGIFPIEGVRRAYGHLQGIYAAFGAGEKLELHVGAGGHRYYNQRVWPFVRERLRLGGA